MPVCLSRLSVSCREGQPSKNTRHLRSHLTGPCWLHFDWSVVEDTSQNASYCEVRVRVLSEGVHAMMRCVEKGEVLGGQKLFIHEKPTLTALTFQHLIIMVMTQQLRIPYMRP